mmetsp:Transcript_35516/g.88289  ORF Transcript_35516/g.88289 Transcript_35516/m.88289 type:complete len:89 (-) Transcript_35516:111-377(-)
MGGRSCCLSLSLSLSLTPTPTPTPIDTDTDIHLHLQASTCPSVRLSVCLSESGCTERLLDLGRGVRVEQRLEILTRRQHLMLMLLVLA